MEKGLCWATIGVAGLMLVVFLADLFTGMPFGGLNQIVDILGALSAALIGYVGWDALQDVR